MSPRSNKLGRKKSPRKTKKAKPKVLKAEELQDVFSKYHPTTKTQIKVIPKKNETQPPTIQEENKVEVESKVEAENKVEETTENNPNATHEEAKQES